jgi:hypothetical protein
MTKHKQGPAKQAEDYRGLAERVREAAYRDSNERQRAELLAMAKVWDFLADHCQHHPKPTIVSSPGLNNKVAH